MELQQEGNGGWSVWIPALAGLTSWDHTEGEALRNIQDAAEVYVEDIVEAEDPIPPRSREDRAY